MRFRDVNGKTHELNIVATFRMATVDRADETGTYLQFAGDIEAREQPYGRLDSYTPTPGDRVLTARIGSDDGGTYIILGKVV